MFLQRGRAGRVKTAASSPACMSSSTRSTSAGNALERSRPRSSSDAAPWGQTGSRPAPLHLAWGVTRLMLSIPLAALCPSQVSHQCHCAAVVYIMQWTSGSPQHCCPCTSCAGFKMFFSIISHPYMLYILPPTQIPSRYT